MRKKTILAFSSHGSELFFMPCDILGGIGKNPQGGSYKWKCNECQDIKND